MKHIIKTGAFALSCLFIVQTTAQANQEDAPLNPALTAYVLDAAKVVGGARFCKIEVDELEEFLVIAEARLSALSRDDFEKVSGRIDFKNYSAAASGKAPEGGCEKFQKQFQDILRQSF